MTPHVEGKYAKRTFHADTGLPKPQPFLCRCSACGDSWGGMCMTGNVRSQIVAFAAKHFHADPMLAPKVQRPTSLRMRTDPSTGEYVKA